MCFVTLKTQTNDTQQLKHKLNIYNTLKNNEENYDSISR